MITKNDDGRNLEITEVVLLSCNIAINNYQRNSRVFYTFVTNKSFSQLLLYSARNFIFEKTFEKKILIY